MQSNLIMVQKSKKVLIGALILAVTYVLVSRIHPAYADVAPPESPPGANPSPDGEVTQVRMVDEKVVIEVQAEEDISKMGTARVWAEFQMLNLGDVKETLMVRFPTSFNDGFYRYPEIEDLMVYVDNQFVPTSRIELEGEPEQWNDPVQWAEFEVVFPPGDTIEIEVDYTLQGTGEYPFVSYSYLLETGAGWNGTIGSAEIIVRLPYKATAQTVFIDSSPGWGQTTTGAYLEGNEVSWYFEDFEPAWKNNISIALVWPSAYNKVEEEEQNVRDFPNDGEAWGRLAKNYKEISLLRKATRDDAGGIQLYQLSVDAYEKSLSLLPNDALWHVGYADLLCWNSSYTYRYSEEGRAEFLLALNEMYIAYTLDPDHSIIQDYLSGWYPREAVDEVNGEYVFYWLTQTPTLVNVQPPATATEEVLPNVILVPTEPEPTQPPPAVVESGDPDSTDEDGVGRFLPICGSMLLFPLVFGVFIARPLLTSKRADQ